MTNPPAPAAQPAPLNRDDLQGLGLAGFRKDHQQVLCVTWPAAASGTKLISKLAPLVATDTEVSTFNRLFKDIRDRRGVTNLAERAIASTWIGVGISGAGYSALDIDPTSQLPATDGTTAFVAGMAARSANTGDQGADAPATWRPGISGSDAIVVIASDDVEDLDETVAAILDLVSSCGGAVTYAERGDTLEGPLRGHEHFGFKDGISQPSVSSDKPLPLPPAGAPGPVALGEFVLGFPDQTGVTTPVGPLFQNGSFLVFRRLSQDVAGFRQQAATASTAINPTTSTEEMAAKMIGRWPSGSPLELNPLADPGPSGISNGFEYANQDDLGQVVPQWSHIRKANPRDETQPPPAPEDPQRHRMIRRGIPFTSNPEEGSTDEGLHFLAVVSDVARQFEFVQRGWMDDQNFPNGGSPATPGQPPYGPPPTPGTPPAGPDPVSGHFPSGSQDAYISAVGATAQTVTLSHELVQTTGGEYYFLPGLAALAEIGTTLPPPSAPPS